MTAKPKPRARRKKVEPAFYTPVDGWKPDPRGMLTGTDVLLRLMNAHRRNNPWDYWAAVRDEII